MQEIYILYTVIYLVLSVPWLNLENFRMSFLLFVFIVNLCRG